MTPPQQSGRKRLFLPDFAPALLADLDAVLVGRLLDSPPRIIALIVRHAFDLVEAGDRVAHVAGVVERLLALLRERELILVEAGALGFVEFGHIGLLPRQQRGEGTD